jgi:hypothetical protein
MPLDPVRMALELRGTLTPAGGVTRGGEDEGFEFLRQLVVVSWDCATREFGRGVSIPHDRRD